MTPNDTNAQTCAEVIQSVTNLQNRNTECENRIQQYVDRYKTGVKYSPADIFVDCAAIFKLCESGLNELERKSMNEMLDVVIKTASRISKLSSGLNDAATKLAIKVAETSIIENVPLKSVISSIEAALNMVSEHIKKPESGSDYDLNFINFIVSECKRIIGEKDCNTISDISRIYFELDNYLYKRFGQYIDKDSTKCNVSISFCICFIQNLLNLLKKYLLNIENSRKEVIEKLNVLLHGDD